MDDQILISHNASPLIQIKKTMFSAMFEMVNLQIFTKVILLY